MRAVLEIEDLSVSYFTARGEVKAVSDTSFSVFPGEIFSIVGESGCGKSTLAYAILRIVRPPGRILKGRILCGGVDVMKMSEEELRYYRWKMVAMIFQGAMNSLNPVHKIDSQIAEAILAHEKISRREALERAKKLLSAVGIDPHRVRNYPHQFSGGMRQRAIIAMAIALNPSVLIADEPTTALDVVTEQQILSLFQSLRERHRTSIIYITHDLSILRNLSDRIAVMYGGRLVEIARSEELFSSPLHPYTQALIDAFLSLVKRERQRATFWRPMDMIHPPPGCSYHPICPAATGECLKAIPRLAEVRQGHYVACSRVV